MKSAGPHFDGAEERVAPRLAGRAADYPMLSRRRAETGTACVGFMVGLTGKVENLELKKQRLQPTGDAALAAVHESLSKPYLENGAPVRAAYTSVRLQPAGLSTTEATDLTD
ncbi:energy transducer TonB [Burkholderia multivorans]|uniref:energy transducer TonB n=1 Tax=Burkholderia multivorans TaxID=87883 RepID=UPI0030DA2B42